MMPRRRTGRFVIESLFLAGVAAALTFAEVRPAAVIALMAAAWLIVAFLEWTAFRDEPHYGRGLPPRFYVPQVALPPSRPVSQPDRYPIHHGPDDAPTFVASATDWANELQDWPIMDAGHADAATQIAHPDDRYDYSYGHDIDDDQALDEPLGREPALEDEPTADPDAAPVAPSLDTALSGAPFPVGPPPVFPAPPPPVAAPQDEAPPSAPLEPAVESTAIVLPPVLDELVPPGEVHPLPDMDEDLVPAEDEATEDPAFSVGPTPAGEAWEESEPERVADIELPREPEPEAEPYRPLVPQQEKRVLVAEQRPPSSAVHHIDPLAAAASGRRLFRRSSEDSAVEIPDGPPPDRALPGRAGRKEKAVRS
ncbi:MAG TPA: hypothetical protein VGM80_18450 [Gaiellaceae bacterium]|jgi:hypothetical protein